MPDQQNLLVLDLDETLIHGVEAPLDRPADFRVGPFHLYRRPGLAEFLETCTRHYALAVWSSAGDAYVDGVVRQIFPDPHALICVWAASRTKIRRTLPWDHERFGAHLADYHARKPLKKLTRLGWPLERILIVDDSPEKCAENFGNAIHPTPWEGDPADHELDLLGQYLTRLKGCTNYRRLEKRRWKQELGV